MSLVASGKPKGKDVLRRRVQTVVSGAAKQLNEMRDAEALWILPRRLLVTLSHEQLP